jgi:hypothetical protein
VTACRLQAHPCCLLLLLLLRHLHLLCLLQHLLLLLISPPALPTELPGCAATPPSPSSAAF